MTAASLERFVLAVEDSGNNGGESITEQFLTELRAALKPLSESAVATDENSNAAVANENGAAKGRRKKPAGKVLKCSPSQ